ncbi:MAG: hypothetical protein Q7R44_00065 [bacterium]|nr:hypothetical protein [bacterium]
MNLKKILKKSVPLWAVILIVLNSVLYTGVIQYYLSQKQLQLNFLKLSESTKDPEELVNILKQEVLPGDGYRTKVSWENIGKQLVEIGVIDQEKYKKVFTDNTNGGDYLKYLEEDSQDFMTINEKNAHFMVNTLWALGLVNKSDVLTKGQMQEDPKQTANFASTGGWTLGKKDAMSYYSAREIIPLTQEQQDLVTKIAENVFRPCCGNNTAFPDCNHGMAALGYIELAVFKGLSEDQIYKDLLAFNSFWFPQTYVEMAVYFNKEGIDWKNVDAKLALSRDYSSSSGVQRIEQSIQDIPSFQNKGGSCGA